MSVITCRSNLLRGTRQRAARQGADSCYTYIGGSTGAWEVTQLSARLGEPLPSVTHLDMIQGRLEHSPGGTSWILCGLVRNTRYISREEFDPWNDVTHSMPTCAALIPIRRSPQWWQLGNRARQQVQFSQPQAAMRGLNSLSSMLRRWQPQCDLSDQFDCVTWFEYEPRDAAAFDDLLADWRASEEWKFVDRECDIRLVRVV